MEGRVVMLLHKRMNDSAVNDDKFPKILRFQSHFMSCFCAEGENLRKMKWKFKMWHLKD